MATLERAIEIAAKAHAGDVDKVGDPYILHPIRVMLHVKTEPQQIAAVLHDVVEDTDVTLSMLHDEGFPSEVVNAVDGLTKRDGESRMDAGIRAAENAIACEVKLADNTENMDLNRISEPTAKDYARLEEYKKVREVLLSGRQSRHQ